MQDSLNYSNSLVKDKQAKMRDFIRQTGQDRDYFREQNYGRVDYKKNTQNSLTSTKTRGIIKLKDENLIIPITDKSIDNVQLVQPDGFSIEYAVALQNAHRRLLKEAQKYPSGTECAMLLDLNMEQIDDVINGEFGSVNIPYCSDYHIALHNHPSGKTFSIADIAGFSQSETMQALTAVGNNGKVYVLSKTISFDSERFYKYLMENVNNKKIFKEKTYSQIDKKFVSELTNNEIEELKESLTRFLEEVLKGTESYGAIYSG